MRPCRGWASGRVLVSGVFLGTRGLIAAVVSRFLKEA